MDARRLNKKLVLQRKVSTDAGGGGRKSEWQDVTRADGTPVEVYAAVEPLEGRELWAAMQTQERITVRVTLRFRADVDASMRFRYTTRYGTRYLAIKGITDKGEAHRWLVCSCEETAK